MPKSLIFLPPHPFAQFNNFKRKCWWKPCIAKLIRSCCCCVVVRSSNYVFPVTSRLVPNPFLSEKRYDGDDDDGAEDEDMILLQIDIAQEGVHLWKVDGFLRACFHRKVQRAFVLKGSGLLLLLQFRGKVVLCCVHMSVIKTKLLHDSAACTYTSYQHQQPVCSHFFFSPYLPFIPALSVMLK